MAFLALAGRGFGRSGLRSLQVPVSELSSRGKSTTAASVPAEPGRVALESFKNIPGPGYWFLFDLMTKPLISVQRKIFERYGKENGLVRIPNILGGEDLVIYNLEDCSAVYRYEQQETYPVGSTDGLVPLKQYFIDRYGTGTDNKALHFLVAGEGWKTTREALHSGISLQRAKTYQPAVNQSAKDSVRFFKHYADNNMMDEYAKGATFNAFLSVLLGEQFNVCDPENKDSIKDLVLLDEKSIGLATVMASTPSWSHPRNAKKTLYESMDKLHEIAIPIIDAHLSKTELPPSWFKSLRDEFGFTGEDLHKIVPSLFSAGIGTTQATFQCMLLALADHPEYQEKLLDELNAVLGEGRDVQEDSKLPLFDAFTREVFRFYPNLTIFGIRKFEYDIQLPSGHYVPANTVIQLQPSWNARDDRRVEKSDQFLPERHLKEAKVERKKAGVECPIDHRLTKDVFGFSKRSCVGKRAALMELKALTVETLKMWKFEATPRFQSWQWKQETLSRPDPFPRIKVEKR